MSGGNIGLKHAGLTEQIIGVFYDVYNELGYGFLESVYEESLVIALPRIGFSSGAPIVYSGLVPRT